MPRKSLMVMSTQVGESFAASLTVEQLPDNQYKVQVKRGHSGHSMADSDTHKKSTAVTNKIQEYCRLGVQSHRPFGPSNLSAHKMESHISQCKAN